jgi:hypothetical protein
MTTKFVNKFNNLPDDIIDIIYSKVVYSQPKNLLDEIEKYGKNREYLYYLKKIEDETLYQCLHDLSVVYLLLKEDKTPYSCDPEQLSDISQIELDKILFSVYNTDMGLYDSYNANDIIYYMIMDMDDYYIEKIVQPVVASIINDEMDILGYTTYSGV